MSRHPKINDTGQYPGASSILNRCNNHRTRAGRSGADQLKLNRLAKALGVEQANVRVHDATLPVKQKRRWNVGYATKGTHRIAANIEDDVSRQSVLFREPGHM